MPTAHLSFSEERHDLPSAYVSFEVLIAQVAKIMRESDLSTRYGAEAVPPAATFVAKLLASGLVYPAGRRFLFFHDAFEDWLAGPADSALPGA